MLDISLTETLSFYRFTTNGDFFKIIEKEKITCTTAAWIAQALKEVEGLYNKSISLI
jgi:hypothetical protein